MVSRRKRHRAGRQFYWQKGEEGVSCPQLRLLVDENLQKIISGGKIRTYVVISCCPVRLHNTEAGNGRWEWIGWVARSRLSRE